MGREKLKNEARDGVIDLYTLAVCKEAQYNLKHGNKKVIDKEREENEPMRMLAMMGVVAMLESCDLDLDSLHKEVKARLSEAMYEVDKEIKKHQDQTRKRGE